MSLLKKSTKREKDGKRRVTKKLKDRQKTINKMIIVSLSLSLITLNVNRLKYSIIRSRVDG